METLESLRQRKKSAEDLQGLVKTMKALAAVSIRQYEKAVASLAQYNRAVEMGFQILLKRKPPGLEIAPPAAGGGLGAVVFGSDQGMVGQFNDIVAKHTLDELRNLLPAATHVAMMAVGQRVFARLQDAGQAVEGVVALPGSVNAVTSVVHEMVLRLEAWRSEREIGRILLFYNRPVSGASYEPRSVHLFPVDLNWFEKLERERWPCRALPSFTMEWNGLFSSLIRQYLFVTLYRAFAESLASENASRLASMQAAERNIEERLGALTGRCNQLRQSAIDAELFDLVAGFEALTG